METTSRKTLSEVPVLISFVTLKKPAELDVYNIKGIFAAVISYYSFKNIEEEDVNVKIYRDDVDKTWEVILTTDTIIPEKLLYKIISTIDFKLFLGYILLSRSILTFMTTIIAKGDIEVIYSSWGAIAKSNEVSMEKLIIIQNEIDNNLSKKYAYFLESPSVLELADKYKLYHTSFEEYIILKKHEYSNYQLEKILSIILKQ